MDNCNNKLNLLLHTLTQLFNFFLPPALHFKLLKPHFQSFISIPFAQTFQARQVKYLISHAHLLIQTSFLRQIPYVFNMIGCQFSTFKKYLSTIGTRNLVNNPDQRCFTCSVWSQESKNC